MRCSALLVGSLAFLQACSFNQPAAPIRDLSHHKPIHKAVAAQPPSGYVVVRPGDNLFRIAFDHGLDYRQLAEWNGISDPNVIRVGERLRLTSPETQPPAVAESAMSRAQPLPPIQPQPGQAEVQALPPLKPAPAAPGKPAEIVKAPSPAPVQPDSLAEVSGNWVWPAKGQIIRDFNENDGAKGIDIAGIRGSPVLAAATGKVIYVGSGLRGYGKLIIIKHSKIVLSAYGHNDRVSVVEGQTVNAGQVIADMGDTDASRVELHFEIREYGKPVDPMSYLPGTN